MDRTARLLLVAATAVLSFGGPARAAADSGYGPASPATPAAAQDGTPPQASTSRGGSRCLGPSPVTVRAVPWAQRLLAPRRVWGIAAGRGITVAVLDSGVSAAAPALSGAVLPGSDLVGSGPADTDCGGHGTFVAGLIAARPVPGVGFAGVAPAARILPVRVTPADGKPVTAALIAAGIRTAVDAGAEVVDVSVGTAEDSPELRAAVRYAEDADVVLVAPVDDAVTGSTAPRNLPAAYPTVLAVTGIGPDGPSFGDAPPGPPLVDLAGPGTDVQSIGPSGPGHYLAQGPSVAASFVAGTAALVRGYRPTLTADQVRRRLATTADRAGAGRPDRQYGYGVVDPYSAVTAILPDEAGPRPGGRAPAGLILPRPPSPDTGPTTAALEVLGAVAGLVVLAAIASLVAVRGRSRRWQPAR